MTWSTQTNLLYFCIDRKQKITIILMIYFDFIKFHMNINYSVVDFQ